MFGFLRSSAGCELELDKIRSAILQQIELDKYAADLIRTMTKSREALKTHEATISDFLDPLQSTFHKEISDTHEALKSLRKERDETNAKIDKLTSDTTKHPERGTANRAETERLKASREENLRQITLREHELTHKIRSLHYEYFVGLDRFCHTLALQERELLLQAIDLEGRADAKELVEHVRWMDGLAHRDVLELAKNELVSTSAALTAATPTPLPLPAGPTAAQQCQAEIDALQAEMTQLDAENAALEQELAALDQARAALQAKKKVKKQVPKELLEDFKRRAEASQA